MHAYPRKKKIRLPFINFLSLLFQDDKAFKQKQKDDIKKMEEMKKRAAQGGPLGEAVWSGNVRIFFFSL